MKILLILLLSGCTTVSYKSGDEEYSMTTWFKSVEDLTVIRSPDVFGLQIGRTNTNDDALSDIAAILKYYAGSE